MKVRAHAKINLNLAVLGTRPDGYHELRTVFQSLALHDTLRFEPASQGFTVACATPGVPLDDRNLVWKAARLVWQAAGRSGEPVGWVHIVKRVNQYEPNRVHLAVYNWDHQPTVAIDVADIMGNGLKYRIVNVLDYFGKPVAEDVVKDGKIALPMAGHDYEPEFGAYVMTIEK